MADDGLRAWSQPIRLGDGAGASQLSESLVGDGAGNAYLVSTVVGNVWSPSSPGCRVNRVTATGQLPWGGPGIELEPAGLGYSCSGGGASFAGGHLVDAADAWPNGRAYVFLPSGATVGPSSGRPQVPGDPLVPWDVAWSIETGRALSVWERTEPPYHAQSDVVGVVQQHVPPASRRAGGRLGPDAARATHHK